MRKLRPKHLWSDPSLASSGRSDDRDAERGRAETTQPLRNILRFGPLRATDSTISWLANLSRLRTAFIIRPCTTPHDDRHDDTPPSTQHVSISWSEHLARTECRKSAREGETRRPLSDKRDSAFAREIERLVRLPAVIPDLRSARLEEFESEVSKIVVIPINDVESYETAEDSGPAG